MAGKDKEVEITFNFPNPNEYKIREKELADAKQHIYKILLDALYEGRI